MQTCGVIWMTLRTKGLRMFYRSKAWEGAKPSVLAEKGITTYRRKPIDWTDEFVDRVRQNIAAYEIFLFFIIYNLTGGGIGVVSSSQASTLTTNGTPNDLLSSLNPLATVIFMPLLSYGLFPLLRKWRFRCGRIFRLTLGVCCPIPLKHLAGTRYLPQPGHFLTHDSFLFHPPFLSRTETNSNLRIVPSRIGRVVLRSSATMANLRNFSLWLSRDRL
jgi:hypothetical protein